MGDKEKLLNILEELSKTDYEKYLWSIHHLIPRSKLDNISRVKLATLFQQYFPDKMLDITAQILQKIPRKDLHERLNLKPNDGEIRALALQGQEKESKKVTLSESEPAAEPTMSRQVESPNHNIRHRKLFKSLGKKPSHRTFMKRGRKRRHRDIQLESGSLDMDTTGTSMPLVTDQQLMLTAGNFGKEWKTIGIQSLEIQSCKLEQIEEENKFNMQMRVFQMLKTWRTKMKKEATAIRLHEILSQEDVPLYPEDIHFLVDQE
uniref:Uncharacterized protein LOC117358048 n=1 Tax=Geotrypetes seraphini TaxID=260995 RepID=A0A6P8R8Z5_GEOSA|nr:uncharacterized protein LOC117358048 [Geotrypetes seraphini]XP_033795370.1 uncharacterized protein LOC117358048 [Geotrypetes seraphini]XP_033795371.1 uncharacterized protein LOC117358048 [Geotrypetes seraphini]